MPSESDAALVAGAHNDLTDVPGIRVGQVRRVDGGWLTGTTVVVPPAGTVGGVDVRGGGPSTRETDALAPTTLVDVVHAVCLSGGSSYGLAAATGVMDWLGEQGVGLRVGAADGEVVPIVPAACLFDLVPGEAWRRRPDARWGRAAVAAAGADPVAQGNAGAGTGAHAGRLKGGLGSASVVLPSGATVAALVALNSAGSVVDTDTGELYGARHLLAGELPALGVPSGADAARARALLSGPGGAAGSPPRHTVLVVVATDAALDVAGCTRVAMAAHDGMARAVRPAHGMTDGDVAFALSTGAVDLAGGGWPGGAGTGGAETGAAGTGGAGTGGAGTGGAGAGAREPGPAGAGGSILAGAGGAPAAALGAVMAAAADVVTRAIVHAAVRAESAGRWRCYRELYPSALR